MPMTKTSSPVAVTGRTKKSRTVCPRLDSAHAMAMRLERAHRAEPIGLPELRRERTRQERFGRELRREPHQIEAQQERGSSAAPPIAPRAWARRNRGRGAAKRMWLTAPGPVGWCMQSGGEKTPDLPLENGLRVAGEERGTPFVEPPVVDADGEHDPDGQQHAPSPRAGLCPGAARPIETISSRMLTVFGTSPGGPEQLRRQLRRAP